MAEYQKDKEEVQKFLDCVKDIISKGTNVQLNNHPWHGRVNKTLTYMAETGIGQQDMEKVICELQVSNYSYTADDYNKYFDGEQFWFFGIRKNIIDKDENLYIKLKIRTIEDKILLIMSFHPEAPDEKSKKLEFPYKE
jgi:hypothetical protein